MNFLSKLKVFFFGHKIKYGQVWGCCIREGNPFMEPEYRKATVEEVKKGWVAYTKDSESGSFVSPIRRFKSIYDELLENVE
jgi:hypothetical protein